MGEVRSVQPPAERSVDEILDMPRDAGVRPHLKSGVSVNRSVDDILANPREPEPAEVSPTGQTVAPVNGWPAGWKAVHDHMVLAGGGFNQSVQGLGVLLGSKDIETAQHEVETQEFLQAQQDTTDYINGDGFKSAQSGLANGLLQQIPTLGLAGVGAAAGAGIAFTVGAPIALPAAGGAALVMGTLGAGNMMYDLAKRNVDPLLARVGSLGAGIINGAVAMGGGAAFSKVMQAATLNLAQRIAANTGINVGLSSISSFVDAVTKMAATHVSAGAQKYGLGEAMNDMRDAVTSAMMTGPFVAGGFEVGGAALRFAGKHMLPDEALDHLTNAFKRKTQEAQKKQQEQAFNKFVANNEDLQNQANAKFEEAINKMTADELWWAMQLKDMGPEVRATLEKRWRQVTDPNFNGHTDYGDGPGTPGLSDKGMNDLGMEPPGGGGKEPPNEPPKGGGNNEGSEEPGGKKPKFRKAKDNPEPPLAPEEAATRDLIDKALVAARFRKGAAKVQLESAKRAQAEGRELTPEEKAALDRETFISLDKDKEREYIENRLKTAWQKWKPNSRTAGFFNVGVRGKLAIAFQDAPPAVANELIDALDPGVAVEHATTLNNNYLELGYGSLEDATGSNRAEVEDLGYKAGHTSVDVQFYGPDKDGTYGPQRVHLTLDQMLDALLKMRNKKARVGLTNHEVGNGFTLNGDVRIPEYETSTEQAFENALGNADARYLHMLDGFANYYEQMGETLKASFEKINPGHELTLEENYGGQVVREGGVERSIADSDLMPQMPGEEIEYGSGAGSMKKDNPSFTKERAGMTKKLDLQGAFKQMRQRARQQAQYEAMAGPAQLWNRVINNEDFLKAMQIKFGKEFTESLVNHYKDVVYGRARALGAYQNWIDKTMQARTINILGLKPMQTVKHLTTLYQFSLARFNGELIPSKALLDGIEESVKSREAWDLVTSWPEVKNRYAETDRLQGLTDPDAANPAMRRAQQGWAGTKWFALGDKPALVGGTYAVYKWVLEKTGSPEIAKAEAVKAYRNILASGALDQQSDMGRSPIIKLWNQFGQPEARLKQHVLESWRQAANFPTEDNLRNAVRTTMISHVAAGLFVLPEALLASAIGKKEDAERRAHAFFQHLLLGNMFPIERRVMETVAALAGNKFFGQDNKIHDIAGNSIGDTGASVVSFVGDVMKITSEGVPSLRDILDLAIHAIQGPAAAAGVGIPTEPLKWVKSLLPDEDKED